MGHSLGGTIALSAHSPRIAGLVLAPPGGLCRLRVTPAVLSASVAWLLRPGPTSSARLLRVMHAPGREPRELLVEWMTLITRHARSSGRRGWPRWWAVQCRRWP